MRSFISSSDNSARAKGAGWIFSWLVATMIAMVAIATGEALFHSVGKRITSVPDTDELWFKWREKAAALGEEALILVGASRMQLGVDLAVVRQETGLEPVQLAIAGSSALPVLADLADDERVKGTVLVSIHPLRLMEPDAGTADERVAAYNDWKTSGRSFYGPLEAKLRDKLFNVLASREHGLTPHGFYLLATREVTTERYVINYPSREREADYSLVDAISSRELRVRDAAELEIDERDFARFNASVDALRNAVDRISARGGKVILVRLPVALEVYELEQHKLPADRFWNRIAAEVNAPVLDLMQVESIRKYELPDGSHIDVKDQENFTRDLIAVLRSCCL